MNEKEKLMFRSTELRNVGRCRKCGGRVALPCLACAIRDTIALKKLANENGEKC